MNFDTYDLGNETLLKINLEPSRPAQGDRIKITALLGSGYGRLPYALLVRTALKDKDASDWHEMDLIRVHGPLATDNRNLSDDNFGEAEYHFATSELHAQARFDFRLQSSSDVLLSLQIPLSATEAEPAHAWVENDACFTWYDRFIFRNDAERARQPVDELIAKHGSANIRDTNGQTMLATACRHGDVKLVQHLLQNGADPNADGYDAPITFATRHIDAMNMLLRFNADVNGKTADGRTALMHAVYRGDEKVIYTLIENDADLNARDVRGCSVLDHFMQSSFSKSAEIRQMITPADG